MAERTLKSPSQAVDEVFITPRVIDKRAFEDYSAVLQDLIRDAAGKGQALQTTAVDVKLLGENLREAAKEIKGKLETAVKVLPALEQRVGKAEQLLAAAGDPEKLAKQLEKALEGVVSEKFGALERRVNALLDTAEARLTAAQQDAGGKVQSHTAEFEAYVTGRLAEVQSRVEALQRTAEEKAAAVESQLKGQWEELKARIAAMEKEVLASADGVRAQAQTHLEETLQRVETRGRTVEERCLTAENGLKAKLEEARDRINAMEQEVLTGTEGIRIRAKAELTGLLNELNERQRMIESRVREVQDRFDQASSGVVAAFGGRAAEVEKELNERLDAAKAKADSLGGAEAQRFAMAVEAIGQRARLVREEIDGSIEQARSAGQAIRDQLAVSLENARSAAENDSGALLAKVNEAVRTAETTLKPLTENARAVVGELETRLERVAPEFERSAMPHLARLETMCAQATEVAKLFEGGAQGLPLEQIITALTRAQALHEQATASSNEFKELRKQADLACAMLAEAVNQASTSMDREHDRCEQLAALVAEQSRKLDEAKAAQKTLEDTLADTIRLAKEALAMLPGHKPEPHTDAHRRNPVKDMFSRLRAELER